MLRSPPSASHHLPLDLSTSRPSASPTFLFPSLNMDYIRTSASNATSFLNPSPKDLVLAIPRAIARIGSFAFISVPERVDDLMGLRNGGSVIAEATGELANKTVLTAFSGASSGAQGPGVTTAGRAAGAGASGQKGLLGHLFGFQHVTNFGGVLTYISSRWALSCFTLAIILNRTSVYALPRRRLTLGFHLRLFLRILPIVMFLFHIKTLLEAMHCQTSPQYSLLKYGSPDKHSDLDYAGDGGLLYYLSSTLLFWQDDVQSCRAVDMIEAIPTPPLFSRRGSLSLLWPLFQSVCFSHFIETLSCTVHGRYVLTETGMSVFEHSLAFAEAEAMISNQLGLSSFEVAKSGNQTTGGNAVSEAIGLLSKGALFDRLNVPPEVLLMGLISSLNHCTSHILGVLNLQDRFRLINTGIWGLCFMSSFMWGLFSFSPKKGTDAVILRFPTVCIVGFVPHLLVFIGVCMCATIYLLAIFLSVLSPGRGLVQGSLTDRSIIDRFKMAHQNLQATTKLSNLRFAMHEDFYTALLRTGFNVLTVASEAVYLNEGLKIRVSRLTWLEEQRMRELEASHLSANGMPPEFASEVATGITLTESDHAQDPRYSRTEKSGYAREKTTKILKSGSNGVNSRMAANGVGSLQRGDRFLMAWQFFVGLFWLMAGVFVLILIRLLDIIGVSRRPGWLSNTRFGSSSKAQEEASEATQPHFLEFWLLSDGGVLSLPENNNVDVEVEIKKRLASAVDQWGEEEDRKLDSTLYGWWTHGGWWGERDGSGTYQVTERDDDDTSVISTSTYQIEAEWESDNDESGSRTPTQQHYSFNRDSSPVMDHALNPSDLARLLVPRDPAERQEARMLAHHLSSDRIVTRSSYRRSQDMERARILTSTRHRPESFRPTLPDGKLTVQEEEDLLEHLLLSRRSQAHSTSSTSSTNANASSGTWQDGADGLGSGGPQCVVCQSSPRTVLAWPCRCLSLCEDCRVSLAMNNFSTCVCCRQNVVGFSRLFVP